MIWMKNSPEGRYVKSLHKVYTNRRGGVCHVISFSNKYFLVKSDYAVLGCIFMLFPPLSPRESLHVRQLAKKGQ
jgi:hypothetical protein